jgi:hypothetical protein
MKKLIAISGKGGSGKSTLARFLVWLYQSLKIPFAAFDGDCSNASLARFCPETLVVDVVEDGLVARWFETTVVPVLSGAGVERVILDLGSGAERLFRAWAKVNDAVDLLAEDGVEIVLVHLMDPSLDSVSPFLEHVQALPGASHVVVFNHGLAKGLDSYDPARAFHAIRREPEFQEAARSWPILELLPLLEAGELDASDLAFDFAVSQNSPLTVFGRLRVKKWLAAVAQQLQAHL